ncbi:MAG: PHB depolymerase family esterase [Sphingomicrobium sp.]|nr:PHB depolymerase family esterase [Sphingomonadales bacterium]
MRRNLGTTLSHLKDAARRYKLAALPAMEIGSGRLTEVHDFGSNPGALRAFTYVPPRVDPCALVVVLHGCTQSAASYDHGSGWSELAERFGFAVLFAEQQRSNNANLCFNWFVGDDCRRGRGEALSIRRMIAAVVELESIDPARIFVTGLSAGGAMTSVMLATYPEVFNGGAIIAGLPFGAASSVPEAFERMRGHGHAADETSAAMVRAASQHRGPWPSISVWHGTADPTVAPMNAKAIIGQWRSLHAVGVAPDREDIIDGFPHRVWIDSDGREAIEEYSISGMGHGTPLRVNGEDGLGAAIPHMLDVGISSTRRIAERWGLLKHARSRVVAAKQAVPLRPANPSGEASGLQATIEAALRSAGLMH